MCFVTDRSKIRLAEKDIECFKIVRKGKNIVLKIVVLVIIKILNMNMIKYIPANQN